MIKSASRILIVTYAYFPDKNPRSFRWTALSEFFAKAGSHVDVLCLGDGSRPDHENINGVNIYRVKDLSEKAKSLIVKKKHKVSEENYVNENKRSSLFFKYLNKFLVFFRWPDFAFLWVVPSLSMANKLIKNNSYDTLISVAHPFSSHLIAYLSDRELIMGKWICDYGDPFSVDEITPSNNLSMYKSLNRWIEKKMILASKNISVTNESTVDLYVNQLGIPREMFKVIQPLFSFEEGNVDFSDISINQPAKTKFIFTGTLYRKIRNPVCLLQLVERLRQEAQEKNIELHFYGNVNDCLDEFEPYKSALDKWLFIHGEVDRAVLYDSYCSSTILVNIGNTTNFQVPSKIIEYMSTGLPVLNIYSSMVDTSYSFLKNYPSKLSISANVSDIDDSIKQLLFFLENIKIVEPSLVRGIIEEYKIDSVSTKYLELMT
jgi:hypothetical protein